MAAADLLILTVCCIAICCVSAQAPKPNIVFIMADDLGFNDVSYHGHGEIKTPNIDELAKDGVRLENYYVGPTCGPTRSQFLSGKYAIHLGLQDSNLDTCTKDALPLTDGTVADALKGEGYATHMIGKWHAGFHTAAHLPTSRGFDTFRGFLLSHSADHFSHDAKFKITGVNYPDYRNNADPFNGDYGIYSTTAFTNRAKELIQSHNPNTPMFMYLSYQAPHTPLQYPANAALNRNITVPDRKKYAAMVEALDNGVGEVVDTLKTAGIYDNTVIIFSSDNGGTNAQGASNYPLRGQKGSYYQGGVRAVGFVSSPLLDASQQDKQVKDLIHVTDWLPTMLAIAGGSTTGLNIDGLNQWNTIKSGVASSRTEVLLNIKESKRRRNKRITQAAMISGEWKILLGEHANYPYPNPQDDYTAWDLVRKQKTFSTETKLFNIVDDPNENVDKSATNLAITNALLARLSEYQLTIVPTIDDEKNEIECDPANHGGFWGPWA